MNMYSEAAKFKSWWDKYEAAQELSEKTGTKLSSADALHCALDRGVRFVVYVPTGTKDRQSRPMEPGLWELMKEGEFGEPGRHQVEYEINSNVSLSGITGAWVGRHGVEQRQLRPGGHPDTSLLGDP